MSDDAPRLPGDLRAQFDGITRTFGPAIERLSAGYERMPERRRDLVQEIYTGLWRSLPSFEARSSLRTWVFRVAHNTAATHVLRERRSGTSRWRSIEDLEATEPMPSPENVEAAVGARRRVEHLAALVRELRPGDRHLVLLHLEGLSSTEIVEITGLSLTNVTSKLSRIRMVLRTQLEGRPR